MTVATDKPKISVYMEPELLKWFQDYCKGQKRSISAQVNFMVETLKAEVDRDA